METCEVIGVLKNVVKTVTFKLPQVQEYSMDGAEIWCGCNDPFRQKDSYSDDDPTKDPNCEVGNDFKHLEQDFNAEWPTKPTSFLDAVSYYVFLKVS